MVVVVNTPTGAIGMRQPEHEALLQQCMDGLQKRLEEATQHSQVRSADYILRSDRAQPSEPSSDKSKAM
jgi:ribosomal protein L16 Arg81 hydroxylase